MWAFKDRLPRGSQFKAALLMDPDLAQRMFETEQEDPEASLTPVDPTPEEYTLQAHLLLAIADKLSGLQSAVIAAAGVEPPRPDPMPRPVTALDDLREEKRLAGISQLIADFSPR